MNDNDGHGFLSGMLIGSALGAMAALLLAPKAGKDLRRGLWEDSERLKARANQGMTELRDRGERALRMTKDTARQAADGIKEAAGTLQGGVQDAARPLETEPSSRSTAASDVSVSR